VTDHVLLATRAALGTVALNDDAADWTPNDDVTACKRDLLSAGNRVSRKSVRREMARRGLARGCGFWSGLLRRRLPRQLRSRSSAPGGRPEDGDRSLDDASNAHRSGISSEVLPLQSALHVNFTNA
jgi:hypothetical protein